MPDKYCVDSSSFLKIPEDHQTEMAKILVGLESLINDERLHTIRTVVEEVKRNLPRNGHRLGTWLSEQSAQIVIPEDDEFWLEAQKILHAFPDIFDPTLNRLQADSMIIGVAHSKRMVMVTDEQSRSNRRPKSRHILHMPDVCSRLGVRSISMTRLIEIEGFL